MLRKLKQSTPGGERRKTRAVCGYHTAPLSWSTPGEGKKRKNVGGVWISRCPVVFVDARWGKEGKCGRRVDITPPPLFLLTPGGGKEEKRGRRVDITSPCCLRRLRGGKKENGGGVWVAHRPVAVADAAGRRGEKIGRRVGSTPPVINAAGEEPSPRRWGE
jgi:hypothetical protein